MQRKAFPRGHKALVLEGFRFLAASTCDECDAAVLWYRTPLGKQMPIDVDRKVPHWWICKARRKTAKRRRANVSASDQLELFPW